jgi:hypothetical protein
MTAVQRLMVAFTVMHQEGARRACASSFILSSTFKVNGFHAQQSIIAAIASMGGEHAPLIRTQLLLQEVLDNPKKFGVVVGRYSKLNRIPGFGSGFVKGERDPIHADIDALIKELSPKTHYYMTELHHAVQDTISPNLYPNTALYSAASAILLNVSPYVLPGMAIEARMPVWNQILIGTINEANAAKQAKNEP